MNLNEYQAKTFFAKYGIPIPRGVAVSTAEDAESTAADLGGSAVVKALVLTGGRGKAGGIRLGKTPREVAEIVSSMLGKEIKGCTINQVLIDEAINIEKEIYLSIASNRLTDKPVLMISSEGGVDIELFASQHPEQIIRIDINPLIGVQKYQARQAAVGISLPNQYWTQLESIILSLWQVYKNHDATLVEINPLVITNEEKIIALDGKMVIDDNALFRHTEFAKNFNPAETERERDAREAGFTYIQLSGKIGCMVNGAGLAMATMDTIKFQGGEPANFLDIGGGSKAERVNKAFKTIVADGNVKSVLVNIFGGITRCDEVARGIITAKHEIDCKLPIVARLIGINSEEANKMLAKENVTTGDTLFDAAQKAIALAEDLP